MSLLVSLQSAIIPVLLATVVVLVLRQLSSKWRPSIPGPPPLPVIGNIHQIPREQAHRTWKEWGNIYGSLTKVTVFGQDILIVHSNEIAMELMIERGQIYSGRVSLPFACGEVGWDRLASFKNPGEEFRETRKIWHQTLEAKKAHKFISHIQSEVYRFAARLYRDPSQFRIHVQTEAGAIILLISHGYFVVDDRPNKDPFLVLAAEVTRDLCIAAAPGKWLIDLIPSLRYVPSWFPGAEFKRVAKRYRAKLERFINEPHEWVKSQMQAGTAVSSCTQILLEEQGEKLSPAKDQLIKWATGAMFGAGSDTTVSVLWTFFLAMSLHPSILAKAHFELDTVIGPNRLPTLDDRPNLAYVEAILTECMRYGPPTPGGVPHAATQDDVYNGYFIKKGTIVIPNFWGMLRDEEIFPDPEKFVPERYLEKMETGWKYSPTKVDPQIVNFGYGRRVCPGREFALISSWNTIAVTLHLFNITSKDEHPRPMREYEYEDGLVSHLNDFQCDIKPRSVAAEVLLSQIEAMEPGLR